jgi:putative transcriptional regulator
MQQKTIVTKGSILLADPFSLDPGFKRTAVILCDHGAEGSVGFILNRPLDIQVDTLLQDFPEIESNAFYGGPVGNDNLHYIHNVGYLLEDSMEISQGLFWGGDFTKLKVLIREGLIKDENIRFFVGYSGWSSGQLADELDYGSWIIAPLDINYVFNTQPEQLWNQIMSNKGENFSIISEIPENFSWN